MAEGLNRATLIGNLAQDPELRKLEGGQSVLKLRVATTERYKDRDQKWQDKTEYHDASVWGARAEALARILAKGSAVYVEGPLRTRSFDKDGSKHYRTEIAATNVILTGGRGQRSEGPSGEPEEPRRESRGQGRSTPRNSPPPDESESGGYGGDDDIPFLYVGSAPETDGIPRSWL